MKTFKFMREEFYSGPLEEYMLDAQERYPEIRFYKQQEYVTEVTGAVKTLKKAPENPRTFIAEDGTHFVEQVVFTTEYEYPELWLAKGINHRIGGIRAFREVLEDYWYADFETLEDFYTFVREERIENIERDREIQTLLVLWV